MCYRPAARHHASVSRLSGKSSSGSRPNWSSSSNQIVRSESGNLLPHQGQCLITCRPPPKLSRYSIPYSRNFGMYVRCSSPASRCSRISSQQLEVEDFIFSQPREFDHEQAAYASILCSDSLSQDGFRYGHRLRYRHAYGPICRTLYAYPIPHLFEFRLCNSSCYSIRHFGSAIHKICQLRACDCPPLQGFAVPDCLMA